MGEFTHTRAWMASAVVTHTGCKGTHHHSSNNRVHVCWTSFRTKVDGHSSSIQSLTKHTDTDTVSGQKREREYVSRGTQEGNQQN